MDTALWGDAALSWPFALAVAVSLIGVVLTLLLSVRFAAQWLLQSRTRVFRSKIVRAPRLKNEHTVPVASPEKSADEIMKSDASAQPLSGIQIRDLNGEPFTVHSQAAE